MNYDFFSKITADLIGKPCCRKRVGEWNSLSLGLGEKILHGHTNRADLYYGEWELGTFSSGWRVFVNDKIVCGSMDAADSFEVLDEKIQSIEFGNILSLESKSQFDIRVVFSLDVIVEFFCLTSDDDEIFHIFGPNELCFEFLGGLGWRRCKA